MDVNDRRKTENTPWTPFDAWSHLVVDGVRRADAVAEEIRIRGQEALEHGGSAVTQMARLGTTYIGASQRLAGEWMKTATTGSPRGDGDDQR